MADYGAQDTSTTSLGANQFPISEAWTPNAGFSAVEGGTQTTDAGGKKSAPVRIEVKDGGDVTQGLTTETAVTGDNPGTLSAKLRGLSKIWADVWDSVNHRLHVNVDAGSLTANAGTNLNTSALAVESGGHLANIDTHTPTQGQATKANSSPVVLASDQGDLLVKGDFTEQASLSAGSLNADLVLATDVSNYKSLSLQINGNAYSGTLTFQWSNDGTNYYPLFMNRIDNNSSNSASTTALTAVGFGVNVFFHYFRVRMTSYASGAAQGTLDLFTLPMYFQTTIAQAGTWTIQPGNTQNTTPWLMAGPNANGTQAANSAANTVIKGSPGWLFHAIVTTLGTAGLTIYDNASTNSGTPLLVIPASAAVGTIYSFPSGARAVNGITSAGVTNCPAVTFHYT